MRKGIAKEYFGRMKQSKKGAPLGMGFWHFLAPEVATVVYATVTSLIILFAWTGIDEPSALVWQRVQYLAGTVALWIVYLLWPCKAMIGARVAYLLAMLSTWYPDTYAINCHFHCMDHVVAGWEQGMFGFQPSLLFAKAYGNALVSELMYFGYFSYYLFFVVTTVIVFLKDFRQFERVTFILFASFYICYVIYILFPVTGPQYYYLAAGIDEIAHGNFPDVANYFHDNMAAMKAPGWDKGIFYNLVQFVHNSGERPTAAFPSSHVAIATLVMLMTAKMRMWKWLLILAIPFVFLCLSTVYIYAHYAIDAIVGFTFAFVLFALLGGGKLKSVQRA